MKNSMTILFIIFFNIISSFACLNEERVLMNGKLIVSDEWSPVPYGSGYYSNMQFYKDDLHELDSLWKANKKINDYNSYGVTLVYLGEYKKALNVFKEIENIKPGIYSTAANLGTTYELLGDNKKAYYWIKEAIRIDPASHDSSEWLHLKILEVKIKGNQYLNSKFLLGTDFGKNTIPVSDLSLAKLQALRNSIFYQLNERVTFIKPKDKIVGLLLFELGNISSITDDATSAYRIYKKAEEYGYSSNLFKKRFTYVEKLQSKLKTNSQSNNITVISYEFSWRYFLYISFGISILIITIYLVRKRKKKSS